MMQRSHLEDPLTVAQLVAAYLQHDTKRLKDEYATDKWQQQFLLDDNSDSANRAAKRKTAHVAHEDLRRMRVVPEKADTSPDHSSAEDGQLADHRHSLQLQIVREDDVAAHIGQHGQRASSHD